MLCPPGVVAILAGEMPTKEVAPANSAAQVSLYRPVISLFQGIVGSGVLALPYCVARGGLLPSTLLFIGIWIATIRTTVQTLACASKYLQSHHAQQPPLKYDPESGDPLPSTAPPPIVSYHQLCEETFGKRHASWIAWSTLVLCQWTAGVGYFVFVSNNLLEVLSPSSTPAPTDVSSAAMTNNNAVVPVDAAVSLATPGSIILCMAVVEMLLCTPRSAAYLEFPSMAGNVSFVFGTMCLMYYCVFEKGISMDNIQIVGTASGIMETFGVAVFAFSSHAQTLSIYCGCPPAVRRSFTSLVVAAQFAALASFFIFSFGVSGAFGSSTQAIVFNNLPPDAVITSAMRLAISFLLVANYPIANFPNFHVIETTVVDASHTGARILSRYMVVMSAAVTAYLCGESFGEVSAVTGGLNAVTAFVLPPAFYLKMMSKNGYPVSRVEHAFCWCLIVVGLFGGLGSTLSGLVGIVSTRSIDEAGTLAS
eukprot:PhM_4_TR9649/c0_g1_i1/m.105211/K14209/SLC36A, PAT; solute carrier family 36 (proton-coupled amino acid transporter)